VDWTHDCLDLVLVHLTLSDYDAQKRVNVEGNSGTEKWWKAKSPELRRCEAKTTGVGAEGSRGSTDPQSKASLGQAALPQLYALPA
jgi:hypothetical protein